jgi:hypothetical protein
MADKSHPRQAKSGADQDRRDRELDAWMDRAIGARKPEPQPVLHDL